MTTHKKIGLGSSLAFAIGSMVGAGVFVFSGVAVQKAGPAAIVSFVLAGIAVLCSAFSFIVVASMAKPGELGYAPVGQLLGHRFWGFLTSWAFYLGGVIGTAFVLHAFGVYMHDFFAPNVSALAWSLIAAAVMTALNLGQASNIGKIEDVLVVVKIAILAAFVGVGAMSLTHGAFVPFMPGGSDSVLATSGLLFIAYLGFSVVTNIAGDVKNPQKTIPLAILLSVVGVMVLYVGVVLALLAFPLPSYDESSVGRVAAQMLGPVGGWAVPVAALVSTLSAANSNILGSSELMVRLAARKDVPTFAGRLWHGHPLASVLFGAVVYGLLLMSGQTDTVIALANVAAIAAIALVDVAAMWAMIRPQPGVRHLLGGPILPFVGLASCVVELWLLGWQPVMLGGVLIAAGAVLYLGRKLYHNPAQHQKLVTHLEKHGGPMLRTLRDIEDRPTQ